jgi:hypothetical protein
MAAFLLLSPVLRLQFAHPPGGARSGEGLLRDVWAKWPEEWSPSQLDVSWDLYGRTVMSSLPPGSVILCRWEEGMTLRYFRYAEALRTDVEVVMSGTRPGRVRSELERHARGGGPTFLSFDPDWAGLAPGSARPINVASRVRLWQIDQLAPRP